MRTPKSHSSRRKGKYIKIGCKWCWLSYLLPGVSLCAQSWRAGQTGWRKAMGHLSVLYSLNIHEHIQPTCLLETFPSMYPQCTHKPFPAMQAHSAFPCCQFLFHTNLSQNSPVTLTRSIYHLLRQPVTSSTSYFFFDIIDLICDASVLKYHYNDDKDLLSTRSGTYAF